MTILKIDMAWRLGYNSTSPLELSLQSLIGFFMGFRRWVEHKHRRSRLEEDDQEQRG